MKYKKLEVIRENSPYGGMKWKLLMIQLDDQVRHDWFKTENEALVKKTYLESDHAIHKFDYLNN